MYDDKLLFDFLKERNFTGLDGGIYSKGKCHDPEEKHYILLTDGLLIYSNIPDYSMIKHNPQCWIAVKYELSYADMNKVVNELKNLMDGEIHGN